MTKSINTVTNKNRRRKSALNRLKIRLESLSTLRDMPRVIRIEREISILEKRTNTVR